MTEIEEYFDTLRSLTDWHEHCGDNKLVATYWFNNVATIINSDGYQFEIERL